MKNKKSSYHFPPGYSLLQTALISNEYLRNPIGFMTKAMEKFSGSYTGALGFSAKMIVTQNAGFINYVLRENHKNYHKSSFADVVAKFFGNGLVYSSGDYWLRQRRLIQPGFHKEKIHGLYDTVIKSITENISTLPVGESVDIYPIVHNLSFNVLLKSVFNIHLPSQIIEELKQIYIDILDFVFRYMNQPWKRLFYPFTGTMKVNLKKAGRLREIIAGIIRDRKASNENYADLLNMLLNSKYEDTGDGMTEEQITDELIIFMLAGHETTGNTLSWLLYLIASNNHVKQKLINSLHSSTIYDSINNEYLQATINEGMRLYPAAWLTDRVALEDDQFGEFRFPKGTIIIPYFFGMHRDKNYWEEASEFKPERFLTDLKGSAKSKNFMPFGAGPRMCIGNNFAMAEMSFFLYVFLNEFNIEVTEQVPKIQPLMILRPDKVIVSISRINR